MNHRERNAYFYIAGQFISSFGSMLVQYAVFWYITLETQSGGVMTLFTFAAMLPMVLVSPFAGVWADRHNRKLLVNLSDGSIALVTLVTAVLFFCGYKSMWILFAACMLRSAGQGIQTPAATALVPQLVPPEKLTRFNGLQSTAQAVNQFLAPMVSGALLNVWPLEYIFLIDLATAAIGIGIVLFCVRVSHTPPEAERKAGVAAYFHEMAQGLRYVGKTAWLKTLFIAFAVWCLLVSPASLLTPLQVTRNFGGDVWRLTAIELFFAAGMGVGSIIMSVWGGFRNKTYTLLFGWITFSVTCVLFGIVGNFWIYMGVMTLCGCTLPFFDTASRTLMQTHVPEALMGAFSARSTW